MSRALFEYSFFNPQTCLIFCIISFLSGCSHAVFTFLLYNCGMKERNLEKSIESELSRSIAAGGAIVYVFGKHMYEANEELIEHMSRRARREVFVRIQSIVNELSDIVCRRQT